MSRETKTIETPIKKHKVVIKTWLTGRERRGIKEPLFEGMKVSIVKGDKTEVQPKGSMVGVMNKLEDISIETVVTSIDEDNKNILNRVLDMCEKDFTFVVKEIGKVTSEEGF